MASCDPRYSYRMKPKMIKFVMRLFGIETKDIANVIHCNKNRVWQIIGGRGVLNQEDFFKIKQLINDEVMGRPLSTVELAERIK